MPDDNTGGYLDYHRPVGKSADFNFADGEHGRYVYSHVDGQPVRNEPPTPTDPLRIAYSGPAGLYWNDTNGSDAEGRKELGL